VFQYPTVDGQIHEKEANLQSLNDNIDTSSPTGKLTFHLFAALAEFERDIIRDRTRAALEAARARGRIGGRPKGLSNKAEHTAMLAETYYKAGELPISEICERLEVSKRTLLSAMQRCRNLRQKRERIDYLRAKLSGKIWDILLGQVTL